MRFGLGAIRLDDIIGGTLLAGQIPAPRFRRVEVSAENAGAVTVPVGGINITAVAQQNVVAGDRVIVAAQAQFAKGVTAGRSRIQILADTGTAVATVYNDLLSAFHDESSQPAGNTDTFFVIGMFRVTLTGTASFALVGFSAGSDSTVAIGQGQIYVWVIPGS